MSRRVVVTGLGVVTPLAAKVEPFWQSLLQGASGIRPVTLFDVSGFKVRFGGEVQDFGIGDYVEPKEQKRLDRFAQFAMVAGVDAVQDARLDFDQQNRDEIGVILGSGIGGLRELEIQTEALVSRGPDRVSPFTIPKQMLNAAGGHLAIRYGLRGVNYTTATACASAANAMGEALRTIRRGECDVVLTGGAEAGLTPLGLASFARMRALSTRNEEPTRASRPFDKAREGFVLSEGAGVLVFEELQHALDRDAPIYGEVLGFGASADAGHITQPDDQGAGAALAMRRALSDAELSPDSIDYVNAHGTGTPLGDIAETRAIKSVFGDHARTLSVSSTKSEIGHSLGASGGIEAVVCLLTIRDGRIHPTANLDSPDAECDLDYTPGSARDRHVRVAISNSFGFGGHNASLIFGAYR